MGKNRQHRSHKPRKPKGSRKTTYIHTSGNIRARAENRKGVWTAICEVRDGEDGDWIEAGTATAISKRGAETRAKDLCNSIMAATQKYVRELPEEMVDELLASRTGEQLAVAEALTSLAGHQSPAEKKMGTMMRLMAWFTKYFADGGGKSK